MNSAHHPASAPRSKRVLALVAAFSLLAPMLFSTTTLAAGRTYTGCIYSGGYLFQVAIGTTPYGGVCDGVPQVSWNEQGVKGATGVKGAKGKRGAKGKPGEAGAPGQTGAKGASAADLELRTYSVTESILGAEERLLQVVAMCDEGDLTTGGGFETDGIILASIGVGADDPSGWQAIAQANPEDTTLSAYVICADLKPLHRETAQ